MATPVDGSPRRRRRERRASATRAALIDAARELMRAGEPLTTVSVTRAVGVTQPSFYAHFKSLEECEREVFREVATRLQRLHSERRRRLLSSSPFDVEATALHLETILQDLLDNAVWFEIAERRRHDPNAMGDLVRSVDAGARHELAADLRALASALGVSPEEDAAIALNAELVNTSVSCAVEALLAGRQTDVRYVARALARVFVASLAALVRPGGSALTG